MSALTVALIIVAIYAVLLITSVSICMTASRADDVAVRAWREASGTYGERSSAA